MHKPLFSSILLLLIFCSHNISAQCWKWARGSNTTNGATDTYPIAIDKDGNLYEVGFAQGSTVNHFGSYTVVDSSSTGAQGILVSMDSAGSYRWALGTHGSTSTIIFHNVTTDPFGYIYVLGEVTSGSFTFSSVAFTDTGIDKYFCIKLNSLGNVLWIKRLVPGNSGYNLITTNATGNFYIAGQFFGRTFTIGTTTLNNADTSGSSTDVFYAKFDSSGTPLWAKSFGGPGLENVSAIALTNDSEFYLAGPYLLANMYIGADTLLRTTTTAGYVNYYVAKFGIAGTPIWAKTNANDTTAIIYGIASDMQGNAYVTGAYSRNFSFGVDILPTSLPTPSNNLMFLMKYDSSGNEKWARTKQETYAYGIGYDVEADNCGNIWVCGGQSTTTGSRDTMFLAEYDSTGHLEDSMKLITGGDDGSGIAIDNKGCLYVGGDYKVDTFVVGHDTLRLGYSPTESLFILKYRYNSEPCIPGCEPPTITQQPVLQATSSISLFPNPANGEFTVRNEMGFKYGSHIEVFDLSGRQLLKFSVDGYYTVIPTTCLAPGLYECKIFDVYSGVISRKLIVNK